MAHVLDRGSIPRISTTLDTVFTSCYTDMDERQAGTTGGRHVHRIDLDDDTIAFLIMEAVQAALDALLGPPLHTAG